PPMPEWATIPSTTSCPMAWSGPTILKPSLPTRTPSASSSSQVAQRSRSRHRALLHCAATCRRTTATRRQPHPLVAARTKECSQAPCRSPRPGHATSRVQAFHSVSCVGGERPAPRRGKLLSRKGSEQINAPGRGLAARRARSITLSHRSPDGRRPHVLRCYPFAEMPRRIADLDGIEDLVRSMVGEGEGARRCTVWSCRRDVSGRGLRRHHE